MKNYIKTLRLFISINILFLLILGCKGNTQDAIDSGSISKTEIIKSIQLPRIAKSVSNFKELGAKGDGEMNCKPLMDSLMKEISSQGGGKIVVPEGVYLFEGPIHFESNINLHLQEGAKIVFSQNPKDYLPMKLVRWEGVEIYNYSPYIYANGKNNIAITGKGQFDGNAKGGMGAWKPLQKTAQESLRKMGKELKPVDQRLFGEGHFLRPSFIQFFNCERILISDITIENVPFWIIQPTYCKSITIKDVKIKSHMPNNDGIDIDSSEDVLIEDCIFNTGDDAIAIKSGRDNDAWRVNRPSKNIVIRNCIAENVLHGIAFGSEMSGGIENVYVENFIMKTVEQNAIQFKSNQDRGGFIRNIYFDGVYIDQTKTAIFFTNNYHSYAGGNSPSEFHHIQLKNIICSSAKDKGINIKGLINKPIHHIVLENIMVIKENSKSEFSNTENSSFNNISIKGKELLFQDENE
ncbi:glycoside hydrolase family 28 protein [Maribacter sp. ANRC-HE7]|uniref:Glycoside hydrolase family 28 protein n=1 Tax=Maribacter aquimaris TaxID=2737171 RepID=A0ABR7V099_9FLAO|nr:glycoside hydrolase family 28 protein [Maribacter aquimaris]MBD0778259.1 glycoside hydrolase family 28 protein [Maribacter aquimaris]